MTICKNNDQAWFSDTLTSLTFQSGLGVQQMLMHRKNIFDPFNQDNIIMAKLFDHVSEITVYNVQ